MRTTAKYRVLRALRNAQAHNVGGWTSGPELCRPEIGGSEGLRRLRELRAEGVNIEVRKAPYKGLSTRHYRIVE